MHNNINEGLKKHQFFFIIMLIKMVNSVMLVGKLTEFTTIMKLNLLTKIFFGRAHPLNKSGGGGRQGRRGEGWGGATKCKEGRLNANCRRYDLFFKGGSEVQHAKI